MHQDSKSLQQKWSARIKHARTHWATFHKRVKHNRNTVSGFNWNADPAGKDFYSLRANLIHGTISAVLPNVYARNPEISIAPAHSGADIKLFCNTLEKVTNRALEQAQLKNRAKSTVRAALTCSFGILKVMYQRDIHEDAYIQGRINDQQENRLAVRDLQQDLEDGSQKKHHEEKEIELEEQLLGIHEQSEVWSAEGLVIDRVLTENLLIDPSVCEFWDYTDADWMCQVIPMKRAQAEALYKKNLANAKIYQAGQSEPSHKKTKRLASMQLEAGPVTDDQQIAVLEIWDRTTQRVYTMVEGATEWLRETAQPNRSENRFQKMANTNRDLVKENDVLKSKVEDLLDKLHSYKIEGELVGSMMDSVDRNKKEKWHEKPGQPYLNKDHFSVVKEAKQEMLKYLSTRQGEIDHCYKSELFAKYMDDPFYMNVFVQNHGVFEWWPVIDSIYNSIGLPKPDWSKVKVTSHAPQPIRARTATLGSPVASSEQPMDRIAQHLGNMGI